MEATTTRRRGAPLGLLLALACALALALAPGAAWAEDTYGWDGESDALAASTDDDGNVTITLSGPGTLTLTGATTADLVVSGSGVVLDLAGCTLTGTGTTSVITVTGSLTIKDSKASGPTEVTDTGDLPSSVYSDGTFTAGVVTNSKGTVTTYWESDTGSSDGSVTASYWSYTSGAVTGGVGTYDSVSKALCGGGVYVGSGGSVTMTGGTVTGNTACGTSVTYTDAATAKSSLGSITNGHGGGVYLYGDSSGNHGCFSMSGGVVSNNVACSGGGIGSYTYGYTLTLEGCAVVCNAARNGAGLYLRRGTCYLLGGVHVCGNEAAGSSMSAGAGVYGNNATITSEGGSGASYISCNSASGSSSAGGGVYITSSATYYGGFNIKSGTITLHITGNSCAGTNSNYGGGGVFTDLGYTTNFYLYNTYVCGNSAVYGGGAYLRYYSIGNTQLSLRNNTVVAGNEASYGGGVYARGSSSYSAEVACTDASVVLANNAATTAGADVYTAGVNETLTITSANGVSSSSYSVTFEGDSQGYAVDGWYDDSSSSRWSSTAGKEAISSFSSDTSYALIAAYTPSDDVAVTFLGAGLRYALSSSGSYEAEDVSTADLRLGFTYTLPVSDTDDDGDPATSAESVTVYWAVGTSYSTVDAVTSYTATGVVSGTAYRYYSGEATFLSNLVVTGVGVGNYATDVYAKCWVVYTYTDSDGASQTVTLRSNTVHRSVCDVIEGIEESGTESEQAYAGALSQALAYYDANGSLEGFTVTTTTDSD